MPKFTKAKEAKTSNEQVQPYERAYRLSRTHMMTNNFLGGISWAVGSFVGLAVFLSIIGILSHYINLIPVLGNFIGSILDYLRIQGHVRP